MANVGEQTHMDRCWGAQTTRVPELCRTIGREEAQYPGCWPVVGGPSSSGCCRVASLTQRRHEADRRVPCQQSEAVVVVLRVRERVGKLAGNPHCVWMWVPAMLTGWDVSTGDPDSSRAHGSRSSSAAPSSAADRARPQTRGRRHHRSLMGCRRRVRRPVGTLVPCRRDG